MALLSSILTGGVNNHPTTSEEANAWSTDFISEGIVGSYTNTSGVAPATGAFAVNAQGTPDMTVAVSTGVAYVTGTPTSQNSQTFRIKNTASSNVTISANSSGSTKYDWVYIKLDATKLNGPNVAGDDAATLVVSRSTSQSSDDGTPPTYGYPIAVVTVSNGASSITNGNIRDLRANCIVNLGSSSVSSGWTELGYAPNTVTALGNHSYSLVFNSTDLTGTVSNGMRLKLPRTVTPPTQCADLESSSSQYFSKTSPSGMTFTDDFTVSAWIKLESYTGTTQTIASRFNGTSGWALYILSSGIVALYGYNAGSGNVSLVQSYQSVPLGKWIHVAAQLDMSTFTATTTTSYVMMDGINVPASVTRTGTNPTALVQAGNLEIGGQNGGGLPFDGKIAQVAIYSAKVTQATILAAMNQTLTGSETSLVSAYTFNNSINDLSANANNLTAQNSAAATNVDSPFNATEYGIVMTNSFSTNTTLTVQVPEGTSLPTSGGINTVSYSTHAAPYGFPREKGKWRMSYLLRTDISTASNANFAAMTGISFTPPAGAWKIGWQSGANVQAVINLFFCLSDENQTGLGATSSDRRLQAHLIGASGAAANSGDIYIESFRELTTATTFTMYSLGTTTTGTLKGASSTSELFAENAYL